MQSRYIQFTQPRYKRGEITRKKICFAFLEELFTQGFHRTNVCEITRRAQLTRGAFYSYWNSLQECLADLILAREKLDGKAELKKPPDEQKEASALLHKVREVLYLKSYKHLRCIYLPLILVHEKQFDDKELASLLRQSLKQIRADWSLAIQRDQKVHIIRHNIDAEAAAAGLLNFASGIIQNMNHDSKDEELNGPLKNALHSFVHSLLTKKYLHKHGLGKLDLFVDQPPAS